MPVELGDLADLLKLGLGRNDPSGCTPRALLTVRGSTSARSAWPSAPVAALRVEPPDLLS